MGLIGALVGLLLPAVQQAREAAPAHGLSEPLTPDWPGNHAVFRRLERTVFSCIIRSTPTVLSEVGNAESFAEVYWEDKIMPYVNPTFANEQIARSGVQIADEKIFRCMSDTSLIKPYVDPSTGLTDGIANRTSYLLNSQLSHKTVRYGRWSFPRFSERDWHFEFCRDERARRRGHGRQYQRSRGSHRPQARRLRHLAGDGDA